MGPLVSRCKDYGLRQRQLCTESVLPVDHESHCCSRVLRYSRWQCYRLYCLWSYSPQRHLETLFTWMVIVSHGFPANNMLLMLPLLKLSILLPGACKDGLIIFRLLNEFMQVTTPIPICMDTQRACVWQTTSWPTNDQAHWSRGLYQPGISQPRMHQYITTGSMIKPLQKPKHSWFPTKRARRWLTDSQIPTTIVLAGVRHRYLGTIVLARGV